MGNLLEVKDLHVSFGTYAGEVQAVRGVSFEVKHGEAVGIVGESGCGKSVTAKSIMKLLSTPPANYKSGSIIFNGSDMIPKSEKEMQKIRGNEISMIFQDPMTSLNPTSKIGNQIMEAVLQHNKIPRKEAREVARKMLELVGIPQPEKRLDQYPHEFSGGMRQRAMIAMALACRPKLLIADEPTTALDVTIQAQILELMKDLQQKTETSIILITHDLGVVAEMCDRVIVMYAGKVVETGTVEEIFEKPQHPYTKGLLKSVPRLDMDKKEPLAPIIGTPPDLLDPPKGCSFYARCEMAMRICKDYSPELEEVDKGQTAACWLHHPMATMKKASGK
ncbi:ABC transporter ATP-binding protein [Heyndrickxia oleronia]|uniref:ABC transporter ATP-binding protein n=2 Tax=Heyndrickxia oleronia TaxID=38875 RepID=A0A8E2IHF4_9BACI|nr:ABC transporter ATP-binding protein [Heyndrickxia oleronia]NYV68809.1 ABC transporter ATP-binding protein [Bacillus sp. Gen3]OJH17051.1 peptide ABC transporter ATP-binding protein [Bacillus obstructivus]MBU5212358.1 ABC transporter ATP-binding protein [Heyndrickxia oleronia]MCM3239992.1 ABC transporter ATP-binding protein [Heyndrickxia oleronia]MCM3454741.1 ABC transporter ATP-binding protein [Heyndrickxia oleronia]